MEIFPPDPPTALQSVTSPVKICSTCFFVRLLTGALRVHDDGNSVISDDGRFSYCAPWLLRPQLPKIFARRSHANLGGTSDDGGDAGGRAFSSDVERCAGMLRFKLLGQLRNELRA